MESVRIGYGKDLVEYDPQQCFYVKLAPLKRMPLRPIDEARMAAGEIYKKFGTAPTLCLSGGLDSECMAHAFLAEGIPFKAATLIFTEDLNSHDSGHAISFCKEHHIPHELVRLDIVKFFTSGDYLAYVKKYFCHTPELAAQLWFLDQISGPFVWAGEAFRIFPGNEIPAIRSISEFEAVFYRYVKLNKLASVPNFHFFSSELAWSFFKESLQKNYISFEEYDPEYYKGKLDFYRNAGFELRELPERFRKLHGFEKVKIYFDEQLKNTNENYRDRFRLPVSLDFPMAKDTYVDFLKTDVFARKILGQLSETASP